jgi:hypothetical protein
MTLDRFYGMVVPRLSVVRSLCSRGIARSSLGRALRVGSAIQRHLTGTPPGITGVPTQVFQAAPFALMILALLLVSSGALDRAIAYLPPRVRGVLAAALRGSPPAALGTTFVKE